MDLRDAIYALRDRERHQPTTTQITTRLPQHIRSRIATMALQNRTSDAEILRLLMHLGFKSLGIDGHSTQPQKGKLPENF